MHIFIYMDFDFHAQYKRFSTAELLKITTHPEKYQDAAVMAASEILKNRVVTQADIDGAGEAYQATDVSGDKVKELVNSYRTLTSAGDKWVNGTLVVAVLQYLHLLYTDISAIDNVLHCENCRFKMVSIMSYVDLMSLPVVLFMFYRRMRWGWILLFVSKLFPVVPGITFYIREILPLSGLDLFSYSVLGVVLNIALVIVLWKPVIADIFRINERMKWMTAAGTIFILLLAALPRLLS